MKHIVLARKWRPKQFKDLVGQTNSIKVLTNIISQERLHHAYLLTGTRGVGKTTIARIIAKALNCLSPIGYEPCATCDNCINIEKGSFVDVIEIDAASNTGVDNIREIIENAQYMPSQGKYKIFIIDEVHMLSKSAFNAMLKTLEEPPSHVIFILATTDLQKVPITVVSRCLQLRLKNLLTPEISHYLGFVLEQEKISYEKGAIDLIAHAAHGSMRDALSILDQAIAFSDNTITELTARQMLGITDDSVIIDIIDALVNKNSTQLMNCVHNIQASGYDYESILSLIQNKLVELQLAQLTNSSTNLNQYIKIISVNDVQLYFEIATLGIESLKNTHDKYPVFVMTLLRMLAFTIGSTNQKEIIIQSSNFNPSITQTQINNTPHNEPITIAEVQNETIVTTPIKEPAIEEQSTLPSNNITTETKENDVPWVEEDVTPLVVADIVEENTSIIPDLNKSQAIEYNGNWVELIEQIKPTIPASILSMFENSKIIESDDKITIMIDTRYEVATNHGDNKTQIVAFIQQYFTNKAIEIGFAKEIDDSLKIKTIRESNNKQLQAVDAINNDPTIQLLINEYGGEIIKDSIKAIE